MGQSLLMTGSGYAFIHNDGGRGQYFKGGAGDCMVRALAIILERDYRETYQEVFDLLGHTPRNGVNMKLVRVKRWLAGQGLEWQPTMRVGQGCRVHVKRDELPEGRLILKLSRHVTTVIGSELHDTYDCSRQGTRCVYGFWRLYD